MLGSSDIPRSLPYLRKHTNIPKISPHQMTTASAASASQPPNFEHWCFISYRHLDNRDEHRQWASWLHQEIEHYEVPAELVGTLNESGERIPARIYPVFRDEDSLSADPHLGEEILKALRGSRTMLVLCSPRSAVSTYVDSEIKCFQDLGRGERIITTIIDGEPNDSARECFPAPLRLVAKDGASINVNDGPLAADFRLADGTQGFTSIEGYRFTLINANTSRKQMKSLVEKYEQRIQLMKLKILSGLLDIPLERLRDRDKAYQLALTKRKAKNLRRWLAAVGALTVLSAVGAGAAYLQTQEARKQEKLAIINREKAATEAANALHQVYRTELQLSSTLIQRRELAAARTVLLKSEPTARGWEWAYLLSRAGATPKGLAELHPDPNWVTASEIESLSDAVKIAPKSDGSGARNSKSANEIRAGKRVTLSKQTGGGGSFGIVYQSDPPTQLFSYWMGMDTEPAKNVFSFDGTVLVWSGEYGLQGGRRANTSTGDMIMEDTSIAPLPNLITLDIKKNLRPIHLLTTIHFSIPDFFRSGPCLWVGRMKNIRNARFASRPARSSVSLFNRRRAPQS